MIGLPEKAFRLYRIFVEIVPELKEFLQLLPPETLFILRVPNEQGNSMGKT